MKRIGLWVKFSVLLVSVLAVSLWISSTIFTNYQERQAEEEMLEKAQLLSREVDAVWNFFEINQESFVKDKDGNYRLYCVIAAKAVSMFFTLDSDYSIHYTNTETRRPFDAPDEFELEALAVFDENPIPEYFTMSTDANGKAIFRYMHPIYYVQSCLDCHGDPIGELDSFGYPKEGKDVGDLAGAVSIIMPVQTYLDNLEDNARLLMFSFALVIAAVILFIALAMSRLVTRPLGKLKLATREMESGNLDVVLDEVTFKDEISDLADTFRSMAHQLKRTYDTLESQVKERTAELAQANAILEGQRLTLEQTNVELAKSNEFKSDFLAIMSHELRTPLTAILAYTELWEKKAGSAQSAERDVIHEIRENAQQLLHMVDNILETARSEAGRTVLSPEPVEIVDLMNATEKRFEFLAQKRNITLVCEPDPDVPLILADWDKLRRIIENLVANAIKYTEPGGRVCLFAHNDPARGGIIIEVKDNGVGIEAEFLDTIFEKYTQTDKSSKKRYSGSGLGLAVVKELAELHGGDVRVDSVFGEGSTFTVRIPWGVDAQTDVKG